MKIFFDDGGEYQIDIEVENNEIFGQAIDPMALTKIVVFTSAAMDADGGEGNYPYVRLAVGKNFYDTEFESDIKAWNCACFIYIWATGKGNHALPLPKIVKD